MAPSFAIVTRPLAVVACLLASMLVLPTAVGEQSSGAITNVAPTVETFSTTASYFPNPSTVVFTGTIKDRNGEGDLTTLRVETVSGPATFSLATSTASVPTSEPPSFSGLPGFKVWNSATGGSTPTDGVLQFQFQYEFTVQGTYVIRALASDEESTVNGPAQDRTIFVGEKVSVAADPVDAAGIAQAGARWGSWQATPGTFNVGSTNYLKVINSGPEANQAFTLDFAPVFSGPGGTIAIDSNLRLACAEGTSSQTPADLTFSLGSVSPTGSISPTFTGLSNVMYCTYQVVAMPQIIRDGTYSTSFTAIAA